ncbi:acyltransferase family protein [Belliella kenyensis]|uniref:Acyltransferase family protein n=1 Tax=Belliella kenyensis TaxID=1472724 RepID=A0ABV8EHS2_9BACT|nr:acyltransferase [Belliella kenyensis]MCH7401709.1 acyltransferase [Belliella kenyensis]MDN3604209.1 acyltransferase [Belliella kenyensis]
MSEIKSLTGIRGLAAIIVAIHHFNSKYVLDFLISSDNKIINYYLLNFADNGYLMVELFFILSGFVLALSYDQKIKLLDKNIYWDFMVRRFNRIYPLYFFSVIIYFILFSKNHFNDIDSFFINLFFLEVWFPREFTLNNVFWSLCTEWFAYLLFPFVLVTALFRNKPFFYFLLIALLIFILAPVLNTERLYDDVEYWILDLRMSNGTGAFLRCLGSYCIGLAIFKIYKDYPRFVVILGKKWIIIFILIVFFYSFSKTDIILCFLFGGLILAVTNNNPLSRLFSSKPVYFLGLISYSVYLNHMMFLRILIFSFNKNYWQLSTSNLVIGFILFISLTLIFSYLTYVLIEKKIGNYLLTIFRNRTRLLIAR